MTRAKNSSWSHIGIRENVSHRSQARHPGTTGSPSTISRYSEAMWRKRRPGYEKYCPMSTWSPASTDTANTPEATISGWVSCFGDTDAMITGSSKATWLTQCEQ